MMRCSLLLATIIAGQILSAQTSKRAECHLSMDIPNRLMTISSSDKEVVYRDKKTNSILTFTKVGVADFDFDLDYTAENVVNELSEDPKYVDIRHDKMKLSYSDVVVINWTRDQKAPNRKNNHNTMALMDVCGQYYTFKFSMPDGKKEDVIPVFMDILSSIEKVR